VIQHLNALSLTLKTNEWLANTRHPRVLHIFDHACNLINEHREILSVVTPKIGNGPFNLVVEVDFLFGEHVDIESTVSVSSKQLTLGNLTIPIAKTKLWNPRPNWEGLHEKTNEILDQLTSLPVADSPISSFPASNPLGSALANADLPSSLVAARQLAGLGPGLTPSGDDLLMGALYAAWIIHPPDVATFMAKEIANTAAPLTTSLSAAWLKSAGRGEAGILWHQFFDTLIASTDLSLAINNLLSVGETSGADALAGFFGVMTAYKERIIDKCLS
jgi:hypothetical protein